MRIFEWKNQAQNQTGGFLGGSVVKNPPANEGDKGLILGLGRFFPGDSEGKASAYNMGDTGSIPGSGRSPGEGNGNPL